VVIKTPFSDELGCFLKNNGQQNKKEQACAKEIAFILSVGNIPLKNQG